MMEIRRSALAPFAAELMFDIVDSPEQYPLFLPWCAEVVLHQRTNTFTSANLAVKYNGLRFSFTTHNPKLRPESMRIHLVEGPFSYFEGEWKFRPLTTDACRIDFSLSYEFRSRFATAVSASVFAHIADTLVDAFINRAETLTQD